MWFTLIAIWVINNRYYDILFSKIFNKFMHQRVNICCKSHWKIFKLLNFLMGNRAYNVMYCGAMESENHELTLILLGPSGVGKTTLVK